MSDLFVDLLCDIIFILILGVGFIGIYFLVQCIKELFEKYHDYRAKKSIQKVKVPPPGYIHGHEYVDLGLPSGLKWATCNIGAYLPHVYGDYFAWGETYPKTEFTDENCTTNELAVDDISGNPQYDAARANWGGTWRMPTNDEFYELTYDCKRNWIECSGVIGQQFVGPNGNSIFIPAAGYYMEYSLYGTGSHGCYWSSTNYENERHFSCYCAVNNIPYNFGPDYGPRYYGYSIRPVSD